MRGKVAHHWDADQIPTTRLVTNKPPLKWRLPFLSKLRASLFYPFRSSKHRQIQTDLLLAPSVLNLDLWIDQSIEARINGEGNSCVFRCFPVVFEKQVAKRNWLDLVGDEKAAWAGVFAVAKGQVVGRGRHELRDAFTAGLFAGLKDPVGVEFPGGFRTRSGHKPCWRRHWRSRSCATRSSLGLDPFDDVAVHGRLQAPWTRTRPAPGAGDARQAPRCCMRACTGHFASGVNPKRVCNKTPPTPAGKRPRTLSKRSKSLPCMST